MSSVWINWCVCHPVALCVSPCKSLFYQTDPELTLRPLCKTVLCQTQTTKCNCEIESCKKKVKRKPNLLSIIVIRFHSACLFFFFFRLSVVSLLLLYFSFVCISSLFVWSSICVMEACVVWVYSSVLEYMTCCIDKIGHRIQYADSVLTNFLAVSESGDHQGQPMRWVWKQTYVRWIPHH